MRQFEDQKKKMKEILHAARTQIHISCDLWTSPNSLAILGIVAYFVDADGKLQSMVLALKEIVGDHTGEHLCKALFRGFGCRRMGYSVKVGVFYDG